MPQPDFPPIQSHVSSSKDAGSSEPSVTSILELLNLPDQSLQSIIARIPLQHLITVLPLVHPRLLPLREATLRKNRHLELFIGNQAAIQRNIGSCTFRLPFSRYLVDSRGQPLYPETTFHRLRLATLESGTVDQLTRLMPTITHLTLRLNQVDILIIAEVIRLLISWSSTLISLTFSCEFTDGITRHSLPEWERERDKDVFGYMLLRLIDSINSHLLSLEVLSLQMREDLFGFPLGHLGFPDTEPTLWMPILGRLKEFYFYTTDLYREFILNTLKKYAIPQEGVSLQAIAIAMGNDWEVYLDAFPAGSPLASRFVHLPYISASSGLSRAVQLFTLFHNYASKYDDEGIKSLAETLEEEGLDDIIWESPSPAEKYLQLQERLLGAYSNLRVVNIEVDATRPLKAVLGPLSSLRQLQVLTLRIDGPLGLDSEEVPHYPSLPGVLALHLDLHADYEDAQHTDLLSPLWSRHFPSVQVVMLEHISIFQFCAICYPNADREFLRPLGDTQYETAMPCLKALIAPLTVLPSLRQIFYKRNYTHKNTLEFSPSGDFIQAHAENIY